MAGRRRRRPHVQGRAAAAALLGLLHGTACLGDAWWLFLMGTWSFGGPRHRWVVSCAVCTRCGTARGSVGERQWLFLMRAPRICCRPCINLGNEPRRRRQRLLAAAEASAVVLWARGASASPISRVQLAVRRDTTHLRPVCRRSGLIHAAGRISASARTSVSVVISSDN